MPGARLTILSSICICVPSSDDARGIEQLLPRRLARFRQRAALLRARRSCPAACPDDGVLRDADDLAVQQAVAGEVEGIDLDLGVPGRRSTKPMSRLEIIASTSSWLSAGTIIISCCAGVTTPPTVWIASCCTVPSIGARSTCSSVLRSRLDEVLAEFVDLLLRRRRDRSAPGARNPALVCASCCSSAWRAAAISTSLRCCTMRSFCWSTRRVWASR